MSRSSLWTKTVALGILVAASVLGNMPASAAKAKPLGGLLPESQALCATSTTNDSPAFDRRGDVQGLRIAAAPLSGEGTMLDGVEPGATDETAEAQVVPAIYAWDPDVKFVFYRHVSKWM